MSGSVTLASLILVLRLSIATRSVNIADLRLSRTAYFSHSDDKHQH